MHPKGPRVSVAKKLGLKQPALDFVDVRMLGDERVFIDPFALSVARGEWAERCHVLLTRYFKELVEAIRIGHTDLAARLLSNLKEPNETGLGLSRVGRAGKGVNAGLAAMIYERMSKSEAVKTGFLENLAECELWIPYLGHDKISDLATNVLRGPLVEYTQQQCALHEIGLDTDQVLPPVLNEGTMEWVSEYHDLPTHDGKPFLLVPKRIVRRHPVVVGDGWFPPDSDGLGFLGLVPLRPASGSRRETKVGLDPRSGFGPLGPLVPRLPLDRLAA